MRSFIVSVTHLNNVTESSTVQVKLVNGSDAFSIVPSATISSVALAKTIVAQHCDKHISAEWTSCNTTIAEGDGCVRLDIPCPTAVHSVGVEDGAYNGISCASNIASQPPISFPTKTSLKIRLMYDDGKARALRYPPPNNGILQVDVISGAASCEVGYDGASAPMIRSTNTSMCAPEVCVVKVQYSESCRVPLMNATVDVWVVGVELLQPDILCHDADTAAFGTPPATPLYTPVTSQLRQLTCGAAGYQQRTLWVAARLSRQRNNPNGVSWLSRTSVPHANVRSMLLTCMSCSTLLGATFDHLGTV
jgi:hypothetical protein